MMFHALLAFMMLALASAAHAQPAPSPTTIDPQLWAEMLNAIGNVSMPAPAHQQLQAIIASVQREAQQREERAKVTAGAKKKQEQEQEQEQVKR